jgi:molybdate transport system regulatory protein
MKIAYKIWIEHDGKVFGDGPYKLLKGVEKTASLRKAAGDMGMAYSKAWKLIRSIEQKLGVPLLDRKVGGKSGGRSQLTPEAKKLMLCYGPFREDVRKAMERIYKKHFAPLSKSQERRRG